MHVVLIKQITVSLYIIAIIENMQSAAIRTTLDHFCYDRAYCSSCNRLLVKKDLNKELCENALQLLLA